MSSSGALIQLVSKGVQDAYLTGDPEVSFWRQAFKRHTNFSIAPARMDFIGTFSANSEVSIKVPRLGDLLSYVWIEGSNVNASSNIFVTGQEPTTFELYIGGQLVDRCDALWQRGVWNKYYQNTQAKASSAKDISDTANANASDNIWDIPFFFSDDWKCALPLVALQYHEVEIKIKCGADVPTFSNAKVYGAFAYLDNNERKFYAENPHDLLIRQTQTVITSNTATTVDVSYFNHPVKSIHVVDGSTASDYTFDSMSLFVNGKEFTDEMSADYYRFVAPRYHAKHLTPNTLNNDEVYTIPFCLSMSDVQPTGTMNFSRLDNAELKIKGVSGGGNPTRVYAVNYNILRLKAGMAGVAFSN